MSRRRKTVIRPRSNAGHARVRYESRAVYGVAERAILAVAGSPRAYVDIMTSMMTSQDQRVESLPFFVTGIFSIISTDNVSLSKEN